MPTTFYTLITSLLRVYSRDQIFLRSSQSLGHAYKEIDMPTLIKNTESKDQENNGIINNDSSLCMQDVKKNIKYIRQSFKDEFYATQSLSSHHTSLSSQDSQEFIEVMTYFFGLLGNQSPLPNYILDKFANNQDDNEGFSLFFDFFNNHLLWLLYESVTLRNYPRSFSPALDDRISQILLSLLGLQDVNFAKEYLPFAPLILSLRKPKIYIEQVLQYTLKLNSKVEIVENIPQQIPIIQSQKNSLGRCNNTLSKDFVLGAISLSHQNKIHIVLHDIPYYEALLFLPTQAKYNKLKENIIFFTNNALSVDVIICTKYHKKMHFVLGDKTCAKLGFGILGNIAYMSYQQSHYMWHISLCE